MGNGVSSQPNSINKLVFMSKTTKFGEEMIWYAVR